MNTITYEQMHQNHELIAQEHSFYTENISQMAASLPCCLYLLALYDQIRPTRLLDLGSGISSYCLRLFKKVNNLNTQIYSVDSDENWLATTWQFCADRKVDISHFQTWDNFKVSKGSFDLIFVDIGMTHYRKFYFEPIFDQYCQKGTVLLFDDMHKQAIFNPFNRQMEIRQYQEQDIRALTLDKYKRFSRLIQI